MKMQICPGSTKPAGVGARRQTLHCAVLAAMMAIAGCSSVEDHAPASQFVINTADGDVLAEVHGGARGLTNAGLVRLIKTGVSQRYQVGCAASVTPTAAMERIHWHVTDDGRKPTAILSAQLLKDGIAVKSAFLNIVAPNAAPSNVFIRDVSVLSLKVLPSSAAHGAAATPC